MTAGIAIKQIQQYQTSLVLTLNKHNNTMTTSVITQIKNRTMSIPRLLSLVLNEHGYKVTTSAIQKIQQNQNCRMLPFGYFPGVWSLYADVSEHSVPSS